MPPPDELLARLIEAWVADPEGDVVYAEEVDGRWATRLRQECREATTIWWEVGQRTVTAEAYVLPGPERDHANVYRLCLIRNAGALRVHFALDREGAIVLRARLPVEDATEESLDQVLAEIHQQVELSFRPLVRMAFGSG